jgi:hypothetical protein
LGTFQIALDPDLRSFWASNGLDSISKIDLETGDTLIQTSAFGGVEIDSLTVVGEPRAAVSAGAAIPTLAHWLLLALAATLVAIGFVRVA